jgi:hypothetical protein
MALMDIRYIAPTRPHTQEQSYHPIEVCVKNKVSTLYLGRGLGCVVTASPFVCFT